MRKVQFFYNLFQFKFNISQYYHFGFTGYIKHMSHLKRQLSVSYWCAGNNNESQKTCNMFEDAETFQLVNNRLVPTNQKIKEKEKKCDCSVDVVSLLHCNITNKEPSLSFLVIEIRPLPLLSTCLSNILFIPSTLLFFLNSKQMHCMIT